MNYRYLISLLFLALFATDVFSQDMNLRRPADFRYYVTIDADTMSSRSLDYKAIQDAVNYKCMYPGSDVVVHPLGIYVDQCPVTAVADTVVVPDTVEIMSKYYDNNYEADTTAWHPNVKDFNLEVRQEVGNDSTYQIVVDGYTESDRISMATNCYGYGANGELIRERSSARDETDLHGFVSLVSDPLECRGIMTYWLTDAEGNLSVWFADIAHILFIE